MRKILAGSVVVLMVVFLSAGLGLAGNGQGGKGGSGKCGGTGISFVCDGEPVTIVGEVSDVSYSGNGLVVVGEADTYEIYGIGPYRYWDSLGIDRPDIGESVTVEGMTVTFADEDETTKIIAMSITIGDETIELREPCVDGVGGWPLWRGGKGKNK